MTREYDPDRDAYDPYDLQREINIEEGRDVNDNGSDDEQDQSPPGSPQDDTTSPGVL